MTSSNIKPEDCICRSYDGSGIDQHGNRSCPVHNQPDPTTKIEDQIDEILTRLVDMTYALTAHNPNKVNIKRNFEEATHQIQQLLTEARINELERCSYVPEFYIEEREKELE